MSPGIKTDHAEAVIERFKQGLGAEFSFTVKSPMGERRVDIVLVPEYLYREEGRSTGLLIVAKGANGSMVWDGLAPLNPFALVAKGFRSLSLAVGLSNLLNEVIETARVIAPPTRTPAQLENKAHGKQKRSGSRSRRSGPGTGRKRGGIQAG